MLLIKSMIQRCLPECNYSGFIKKCKPLVTLKKPLTEIFFVQMKPALTCIRMMGRQNCGAEEKQLMTGNIPHHVSNMVETIL